MICKFVELVFCSDISYFVQMFHMMSACSCFIKLNVKSYLSFDEMLSHNVTSITSKQALLSSLTITNFLLSMMSIMTLFFLENKWLFSDTKFLVKITEFIFNSDWELKKQLNLYENSAHFDIYHIKLFSLKIFSTSDCYVIKLCQKNIWWIYETDEFVICIMWVLKILSKSEEFVESAD